MARVLDTLDQSIADYRREYFAVPASKADPVLAFLSEREVRDNMAGFNSAQKFMLFL